MDLSFLAAIILAVNLVVFLGGCALAVYRTLGAPGRQTAMPKASAVHQERSGARSWRSFPVRLASRMAATPDRDGK